MNFPTFNKKYFFFDPSIFLLTVKEHQEAKKISFHLFFLLSRNEMKFDYGIFFIEKKQQNLLLFSMIEHLKKLPFFSSKTRECFQVFLFFIYLSFFTSLFFRSSQDCGVVVKTKEKSMRNEKV